MRLEKVTVRPCPEVDWNPQSSGSKLLKSHTCGRKMFEDILLMCVYLPQSGICVLLCTMYIINTSKILNDLYNFKGWKKKQL